MALSGSQQLLDVPLEQLEGKAPYGFDVTPNDGAVWLNMAPVGAPVDYSVKASDFLKRSATHPEVWIRGYHKRDSSVPYRVSLHRIVLDCAAETYRVSYLITYRADGAIEREQQASAYRSIPIVPGSQAGNWHRFICKK